MIKDAGMGGTVAPSGQLAQTVGAIVPIPSPLTPIKNLAALTAKLIQGCVGEFPASQQLVEETIVANRVEEITLGIDVSKNTLEICIWPSRDTMTIDNESAAIKRLLRSLSGPIRIAIEPTSTYHLEVVDVAMALKLQVYLVNTRLVKSYAKAIGARSKTDPIDAWVLARYLNNEGELLRPHRPQSRQAQQLWALIKRRAMLVNSRKATVQSLRGMGLSYRGWMRELQLLIVRIEKRIKCLITQLGWNDLYHICQSIPGIGEINAAALVSVYHRGAFASSDAFVAFIGMDVRQRQSGKYTGQSKLSKCGEPEVRRLLFCAAQASRSYPLFDQYLQHHLDKGRSNTAAKNALARKLARIAFALMSKQENFKKREAIA